MNINHDTPHPTIVRYHTDLVTEGPAQWLSPSLPACRPSLSLGEPIITQISRSGASSLEKLDTKVHPLSLMMASRSLWCLQTCSRKRHATPAESTVVMVGMAWMHLDSLSTTTRMALYPLDSGSSLMVSTEITSQ